MILLLVILFLFFLTVLVVGGFGVKILIQTISRQGDLGINLRPVICPKCSEKATLLRPSNLNKQIPWGGGVCSNCGCGMDKWGHEISTISINREIPKLIEASKKGEISTYDKYGKTPLERVFDENDE